MGGRKDMTAKTLIEEPKLQIQASNDGVWLYFQTSDGNRAGLNLPTMYSEKEGIIARTIIQWCKDYAATCPPIAPHERRREQPETHDGK